MTTSKKAAVSFLAIINIINFLAGVVTQLKILLGKDVLSLLPIKADLSTNQTLMINFSVIVLVMLLINIATTQLATDVPYSPIEVMENFAAVFLFLPAIVTILGVYNGVTAQLTADKIAIIGASVFHLIASAINIACVITIKEDTEA